MGRIDFVLPFWYIFEKFNGFLFAMKKGKRFLNLKLGKRITHRPKPLVALPKKKAGIGRTK